MQATLIAIICRHETTRQQGKNPQYENSFMTPLKSMTAYIFFIFQLTALYDLVPNQMAHPTGQSNFDRTIRYFAIFISQRFTACESISLKPDQM